MIWRPLKRVCSMRCCESSPLSYLSGPSIGRPDGQRSTCIGHICAELRMRIAIDAGYVCDRYPPPKDRTVDSSDWLTQRDRTRQSRLRDISRFQYTHRSSSSSLLQQQQQQLFQWRCVMARCSESICYIVAVKFVSAVRCNTSLVRVIARW